MGFTVKRLQLAMAGNGNPRAVLTPYRQQLVYALLEPTSVGKLGKTFGLSEQDVRAELEQLETAGLVARQVESYVPTFLVVTQDEARNVDARAKRTAELQAEYLTGQWAELKQGLQTLGSEIGYTHDLTFMMIGNALLDQGLLGALAREAQLMPPMRARPTAADPDAHYYLWLIEGTPDLLGRYGQRVQALPWENWYLVTFGEYYLKSTEKGVENVSRTKLEHEVREVAAPLVTPESLARQFSLPLIDEQALGWWQRYLEPLTTELVTLYKQEQDTLIKLFESLKVARHLPANLGEFICWYDHLTYAHTIDLLARRGLLQIPASRFTAALWQIPD